MLVAEVGPDVEVEAAVAVIVKPDGCVAVAPVTHAGLLGHIGKGAVPVGMVENVLAPFHYIEIQVAVVVIVAPDGVHGGAAILTYV